MNKLVLSSILIGGMLVLLHFSNQATDSSSVAQQFVQFKAKYGKLYTSAEETQYRLQIFKQNAEMIAREN